METQNQIVNIEKKRSKIDIITATDTTRVRNDNNESIRKESGQHITRTVPNEPVAIAAGLQPQT